MGECSNCKVCCTLSVVTELDKKAGETCSKCTTSGCSIYGNHPQVCKDFECAYYQGGTNEELRPDKCGVMFFKKTDRIFCGIKVPDIQVTDLAMGQIKSLNKQGYSVVLLEIGEKPYIMLANTHITEDIYKEYTEVLKKHGNI